MTKRKPPELHKRSGRKPKPKDQLHKWTLPEIMARCGLEEGEEDMCWEWRCSNGEPPKTEHCRRFTCIKHGGERVLLRRLCWELHHGEPPDPSKLLVMTVCDNPRCCNPTHATQMTESQKCQRAARKGAFSGWAKRAKIAAAKRAKDAKITMEIARKIRADPRKGQAGAADYGISKGLYNRIQAGLAWVEFENNPFMRMAA